MISKCLNAGSVAEKQRYFCFAIINSVCVICTKLNQTYLFVVMTFYIFLCKDF